MKEDIFAQKFTAIIISVRFLGVYWEFWSEYVVIGDDRTVFFRTVRDKYKKKFNGRTFKMRLYYPDETYIIHNKGL